MLLQVENTSKDQSKKARGGIRHWVRNGQQTIKAMGQMSVLALRAQPHYFLATILLQCLQGLFPLTTAWVTKVLFDLLAHSLQSHTLPFPMHDLWLALAAQALVLVCSGIISPANQYFNAELS